MYYVYLRVPVHMLHKKKVSYHPVLVVFNQYDYSLYMPLSLDLAIVLEWVAKPCKFHIILQYDILFAWLLIFSNYLEYLQSIRILWQLQFH